MRNNNNKNLSSKKQIVDIQLTTEDGYTTEVSVNLTNEKDLENMVNAMLSDKGLSDFEYNETLVAIYSSILDSLSDNNNYQLFYVQQLHEKALKHYVDSCFNKSNAKL